MLTYVVVEERGRLVVKIVVVEPFVGEVRVTPAHQVVAAVMLVDVVLDAIDDVVVRGGCREQQQDEGLHFPIMSLGAAPGGSRTNGSQSAAFLCFAAHQLAAWRTNVCV